MPDKSREPESGTRKFSEAERQKGQETRPNAPEIIRVSVPKPPPAPKKSSK